MAPAAAALLVTGCIPFAAFSWAVKRHFRLTGAMPNGMKLISLLSLGFFVWFCWRLLNGPPITALPLIITVTLFMLALWLFVWTIRTTRTRPPTLAFDGDLPVLLYHNGPYGHVRHPFYVAYLIFWIGTACATPGVTPWLAPVVMLLLYSNAAWREERKFARSPFAAAYADYRARVGMFLPRPWPSLPK